MDDNYDFLNELIQDRAQKTYKRNIINIDPINFYSDSEFFRRFRLTKKIFLNILMPMVFTEQERQIHTDLRGLPVNKMWKVLIALRFYATGCYQVILLLEVTLILMFYLLDFFFQFSWLMEICLN